jgi:TPP-dependent indolepyruvate ferredoxin oxidoreductase alpha subunit
MAILFPLRGLWLEKHVGLTVAKHPLLLIDSDNE